MSTSNSGCLEVLLALLASLFLSFSAVDISAPQPLSADGDPTHVMVLAPFEAVAAAQLEEARAIIETRLATMTGAGQVSAATAAVEDGRVVVRFAEAAWTSPDVVDAVLWPGWLELVDVSAAGDDAALLVDTLIFTSRALELGADPGDDPVYPTVVGREGISSATVIDSFGSPAVQVWFTPEAAARLAEFTGAHVGQPLAIVVDYRVYSVPVIQDVITDTAVISGNFTPEQAAALALKLSGPPLPVAFYLESLETLN